MMNLQLVDARLRDPTGKNADLLVVSPKLLAGRIELLDTASGTTRYEHYEQIRLQIARGCLQLERPGTIPAHTLIRRDPVDDSALSLAVSQVVLVRERMRRDRVSANRAYNDLAKERSSTPTDLDAPVLPGKSTIFRHLARDRKGLPLLIGQAAKGNRTARYSEEICSLVLHEAETHYLKPKSTWTLLSLTRHVSIQAQDRGLIPQAMTLSRAYVRGLIASELSSDVTKARMDPRDVASGKSVAKTMIRLSMPLQRVEQDGLHLPFVVNTPFGRSSNIWLVHAIDCFMSAPLGWVLVIGSPTVSDSLKCIGRSMFPRTDQLAALGIQCQVDLFGTPLQLIWDNGPETQGKRLLELTRLGINIMYCKALHAQGKPFIERLNRSLKEALEVLPGCTRFEGVDGKRDPVAEGDVLMDIEELEKWIARWFHEVWLHQPLKRLRSTIFTDTYLGNTPTEVWKRIVVTECMALPLPPNQRDWFFVRYERETCTLSRKTGITTRSFSFAGPKLDYLVNLLGETEMSVLVDPEDFRFVWVPVGDQMDLIQLVNKHVDDKTPAHSYKAAKQIRNELPREDAELAKAAPFWRDIYKRSAPTTQKSSVAKKSSRADSRDTAQRARAHAAVQRAAQTPITASEPLKDSIKDGNSVAWASQPGRLFEVRDLSGNVKP